MGKQITRTAIILDKSGSMASMKDEAVGAFNDQLAVIQKEEDEGHKNYVTLLTFSTFVDKPHYENTPANKIPQLTADRYKPDGGTAMLDAVGKALDLLETAPDAGSDDTSFLVVVVSDGHENSSRNWDWKSIAKKVKSLQDTNRWTFVYLGANQDLSQVSQSLNIPTANTQSFCSGPQGLTGPAGPCGPRGSHTRGLKNYFTGRKAGTKSTNKFYGPSV